MIIHSKLKDYNVIIEDNLGFLKKINLSDNAQFVIDHKVYELYQEYFSEIPEERLYLIEANEENKIIDTVLSICEKMTEISAKRNAVLISVGGGIIQDITGFVANVLYRGIRWIFVPTTLLASCDSCIGGKTSLNFKKYKNLLGTFYPPDEIHICPGFFKTLSDRDFESGMGEIIKFNIMAGGQGINNIQKDIGALLRRCDDVMGNYVKSSLLFKKDFIEIDEFDKNERIKLNFAHTFGHAIETVSVYAIPHGTAVAMGMIMANHISVNRNLLSAEIAAVSEELLLQVIHVDYWNIDLPVEVFINSMRKDKKQVGNHLTAVLMTDIPKDLRIVHDIKEDEVVNALEYFKKLRNQKV